MITSSSIQTCPYYNSLEYQALLASFPKEFGKLYKFSYVPYNPPARYCATRRDIYDYLAPETKLCFPKMRKNLVLNNCELDCRNVNPPIPNLWTVLSQKSHSYRNISVNHHEFIRIITKRPNGHTNVPKSCHRRFHGWCSQNLRSTFKKWYFHRQTSQDLGSTLKKTFQRLWPFRSNLLAN